MTLPLSPHTPLFAAGIETFTGATVIKTGLRAIQAVQANIAVPSANTTFVKWELTDDGAQVSVTLTVLDSTYTKAVNSAKVSWLALGQ